MILRTLTLAVAFLQLNLMNGHDKPKQYVVYAAEPQTITAAKPTTLDLHFQVLDGYHVNSHTPKSELLIPTSLTLPATPGVKLGPLAYPKGQLYSFSFNPGEKLDVYAGTFAVKLPIEAAPGDHTLTGTLHYQACDHAACYPPRSLPIQLIFTAR
jgi:hypothetical protein